jgi:hypothetical protein
VALAEVAFLLGFLLFCIWLYQPVTLVRAVPAYAVFFAFAIWSHRRHGETLADLGIRFDNLGRALLEAVAVFVPALLIAWGAGLQIDQGRHVLPDRIFWRFLAIYPWALFQQYGLQALFGRRLETVLGSGELRRVTCAAIFAALHLPNPFLTVLTFGAGWCFCALYERHPNLFAVAAAHALASAVLTSTLPPTITFFMRVGPGCPLPPS